MEMEADLVDCKFFVFIPIEALYLFKDDLVLDRREVQWITQECVLLE